jgi:hypothetical protein
LGVTRANNALLSLGAGASLSLYSTQATGAAHVIVDVNGYLE